MKRGPVDPVRERCFVALALVRLHHLLLQLFDARVVALIELAVRRIVENTRGEAGDGSVFYWQRKAGVLREVSGELPHVQAAATQLGLPTLTKVGLVALHQRVRNGDFGPPNVARDPGEGRQRRRIVEPRVKLERQALTENAADLPVIEA